jgi:transposase
MRPQRSINEESKELLKGLLKRAKTKADFQRVQSIWLRAEFGMDSNQVARAVGYKAATVRVLWSKYFAQGEDVLIGQGSGGRRRSNLNLEEEQRLLDGFLEKATSGGVLIVSDVKAAYEEAVSHRVPKSTVYRMLARHGWRKITPRPRHPKYDPKKADAFKKNSKDCQQGS